MERAFARMRLRSSGNAHERGYAIRQRFVDCPQALMFKEQRSMRPQVRFCPLVVTACVLTPAAAIAQASAVLKPITHEALWMNEARRRSGRESDGRWVVYSVLEPSYETDKAVSDLWLVPADGSKAPRRHHQYQSTRRRRRVVSGQQQHRLQDQAGNRRCRAIYILNLAEGGEARRLTSVSTGASNPKWRTGRQGNPIRIVCLSKCHGR